MQDRKGFPEHYTDNVQLTLPLPLPPAPGIRTTRRADMCRYCHSCHMNVVDFIACREANT